MVIKLKSTRLVAIPARGRRSSDNFLDPFSRRIRLLPLPQRALSEILAVRLSSVSPRCGPYRKADLLLFTVERQRRLVRHYAHKRNKRHRLVHSPTRSDPFATSRRSSHCPDGRSRF